MCNTILYILHINYIDQSIFYLGVKSHYFILKAKNRKYPK